MKDKSGNRDQDHQKGKAKCDDAESLCHIKKFVPELRVLNHFAPAIGSNLFNTYGISERLDAFTPMGGTVS